MERSARWSTALWKRSYRRDPDWDLRQLGYIMDHHAVAGQSHGIFTLISDNKYVILFSINIMLLLLGTLMDMAPLILILTPSDPAACGPEPGHGSGAFGMMIMNLGMGLITPHRSASGAVVGSAVANCRSRR